MKMTMTRMTMTATATTVGADSDDRNHYHHGNNRDNGGGVSNAMGQADNRDTTMRVRGWLALLCKKCEGCFFWFLFIN